MAKDRHLSKRHATALAGNLGLDGLTCIPFAGANFYFNHFVYRYVAGLPNSNSEVSLSEQGGESPKGPASPISGADYTYPSLGTGMTPSNSNASLSRGQRSRNDLVAAANDLNGRLSDSSAMLDGASAQGLLPSVK